MHRFGLISNNNLYFIQRTTVATIKKIQSAQKFTAKSRFLDDYVELLLRHPLKILIFVVEIVVGLVCCDLACM